MEGFDLIQAVFFDLFETLITEWEGNQKKATYSVEQLGLDESFYKKEWAFRRDRRMSGAFKDHQSALRDILKSNGKPINEEIISMIHNQRVHVKSVPFDNINQDILTILTNLKEMNMKIGLVSNCAPEEVTAWNTSPLATIFDDVVFSYQVKQSKPDAAIYLTACENLKVSPQESIFIGDGGSNELQGAKDVGMKAYQASWFHLGEHITGFPRLHKPLEVLNLVTELNLNKELEL